MDLPGTGVPGAGAADLDGSVTGRLRNPADRLHRAVPGTDRRTLVLLCAGQASAEFVLPDDLICIAVRMKKAAFRPPFFG